MIIIQDQLYENITRDTSNNNNNSNLPIAARISSETRLSPTRYKSL